MANWDNLKQIDRELADLSLEDLKSNLTRRIERKHYAFLADIWKGNHKSIEDKEMLLEMLQAGGGYNAQGRYDKSEECYRKALAIKEKKLGAKHPDTAATYNNLATLHMSRWQRNVERDQRTKENKSIAYKSKGETP